MDKAVIKPSQKIFIIGYGAIAKALAVSLAVQKKEVIILRGRVDHTASYEEHIQVASANNMQEATIEINTLSNFDELNGIVVLTNKSFGNEALAEKLITKINQSPLVLLQNGLGIEDSFIQKNYQELYRCVLFATSQPLENNQVRFKLVTDSPIGVIKGSLGKLEQVVAALTTPTFPFKAEAAIQPVIWKKAIINCVFNSICPLLETDNGIFHRNEQVLEMAKTIIEECVSVANDKGIRLSADEVLKNMLTISKLSDGQLISTLQDIRNKKPTEIDTLNFQIIKAAQSLGKENKIPYTKLLGELTKIKSELSRTVLTKLRSAIDKH